MSEQFPTPDDKDEDFYDQSSKDDNQGVDNIEDQGAYERDYTLSISDEDRQKSFEVEDRRWEKNQQIRDWTILIVAILFWIGFQLSFYFLVPGIR